MTGDKVDKATMVYGNREDIWVANKVRMLMRDDLDHEFVCVGARDRIMYLSQEVERLTALCDEYRGEVVFMAAAVLDAHWPGLYTVACDGCPRQGKHRECTEEECRETQRCECAECTAARSIMARDNGQTSPFQSALTRARAEGMEAGAVIAEGTVRATGKYIARAIRAAKEDNGEG